MSFSRFGCEDSDVYTFFNSDGFYECCGCIMNQPKGIPDPWCKAAAELVEHLKAHQAAGHTVPDSCFEQIGEWETECAT